MSAAVAKEKKAWGTLPGMVHRVLIEQYQKFGVSPPVGTLAKLVESDTTAVGRILRNLCADGFISQPFGSRSGYVPLRDPDGKVLRFALVSKNGEPAGQPKQSTKDLLEEVMRRVEEGEA